MLFRVFPRLGDSAPDDPGGPLFVPRADQGPGRHDNPDSYGAVYLSRVATSPVAELMRTFRRQRIRSGDFRVEEATFSLVAIDESDLGDELLDLDEPGNLAVRKLRPSTVATRHREITQETAASIFGEGHAGFEWWSAVEASWINVTLFAERSVAALRVHSEPEPLTTSHPAVREAAEMIGLSIL